MYRCIYDNYRRGQHENQHRVFRAHVFDFWVLSHKFGAKPGLHVSPVLHSGSSAENLEVPEAVHAQAMPKHENKIIVCCFSVQKVPLVHGKA